MRKTRHNPPKKPDPSFIKFSKVQQKYLNEVLARQRREFNEAVQAVYEELGIMEKILQASPGKYIMRKDRSGLDILPVKPNGKDSVILPK